ncbi:Structural maintenance of chromosomes protein 5 [Sergentomyia squamirostris]
MADNYRGKIHSVTVNNFITYDSVKLFAGPFLNVLIGPNGTGKSTIVAAIVIGMGGSCQTLSRGKKLEDYVKNGKTKAAIQIDIYKNNEREIVEFYRSFDLTGSGSFKINKEKKKLKEYLAEVKKYNIQVDNLCQFLPQDRVQDFAKMNPEEIFRNTLKSVCEEKTMVDFEKLCGMEKTSKTSGGDLAKWRTEMKASETQNEQLKVRIDNMAQRTKLQEKLQLAKVKKTHIDLDDLTAKSVEEKRDLTASQKRVKEHEANLAPIKTESQDYLKQLRAVEADMERARRATDKLEEDYERHDTEIDKYLEEMRQAKQTFTNAKMQKDSQEADIIEETNICETLILDTTTACQQIPTLMSRKNTLKSHLKQLHTETELLSRERVTLQDQVDTDLKAEILAVRRGIERLENQDDEHIAAVRNTFPDMCRAYKWLKENRNLFRGRVYNPILIELKLRNPAEGKFLENIIPFRDLQAFVCEDTQDMKLLVTKLTKELKLRVNVVQSDPADTVHYKPRMLMQELSRYGFTKYLLQMVDGPAPILNYLCRLFNIHNIPMGTDATLKKIDSLISWGKLSLFFTPNHRYSLAKSKYSAATSTSVSEIMSRNILRVAADMSQVEVQKEALEDLMEKCTLTSAKIQDHEQKITQNETKMRGMKVELSEIEAKLKSVEAIQKRMQMHQDKLKELKEMVIDLDEEKRKFKKSSAEAWKKKIKILQLQFDVATKCDEEEEKLEFHRRYLVKFHAANAALKAKLCQAERAVEEAQKMMNTIRDRLEMTKKRIQTKKSEIKSILEEVFASAPDYANHEDYKSLPAGAEELDEVINGLQAQVDCMEGHNEAIVREYEERQRKIESLLEKISSRTEDQQKINREIEELHERWFPKINRIVDIINEKFSQFMASMDYAGEVALTKKDTHAYSSYGITIKVVYRNNEALQQLNSFLQSGGERTVAIATYTLALQHLSQVPFRCVDEINQGMDPKNERKIFEMLIDETAQPGMSQYFFITPKLLSDLRTNDYVTFHCVFNGAHVENSVVFLRDNEPFMSQI